VVGVLDCACELGAVETPIFRKMLRRWVSRVFLLRKSSAAIWWFDFRSTTSRASWSSRSVSVSTGVPSAVPARVRRWRQYPSFPSSRSVLVAVAERAACVEVGRGVLELGDRTLPLVAARERAAGERWRAGGLDRGADLGGGCSRCERELGCSRLFRPCTA
jgi:hypothetical protein